MHNWQMNVKLIELLRFMHKALMQPSPYNIFRLLFHIHILNKSSKQINYYEEASFWNIQSKTFLKFLNFNK